MLLPDKHLSLNGSVLGVGAYVLGEVVEGPVDLDLLARKLAAQENRKGQGLGSLTSELLLALSFLYAIDAIKMDDEGNIVRCV